MLISTFQHLKGVASGKEAALWKSGILTWDDYDRVYREQQPLFALANQDVGHPDLLESRRAFREGDTSYFAALLEKHNHYRIALAYPEQTVFLDIESTGLSHYYDHLTLIGLGWADHYHCHIKGDDLRRVNQILAEAKCIVTFNGTIFDLAFLRREFPGLRLPDAHVDLRFLAKRVGLRGGQKEIERQIKIERAEDIKEMRGEAAVLLWHDYKNGDIKALRKVVAYNHADVHGMKLIFDEVVDRLIKKEASVLAQLPRPRFGDRIAKLSFSSRANGMPSRYVHLRPFKGPKGPAISWKELAEGDRSRRLRVVGIDLTGSERRPTGWCLLDGNRAYTKTLRTDDELIAETVAVKPDLVSIDSPLSLPKGRIRVGDDDPGRDKYGIMRQCERTLKKRGVNVYPCLLPSMQGLTARGIRLANHLRGLGLPVIESYPGAAQDIMGIPRKRASLDYLKRGLGQFGVKGEFLTKDVTHDEVDAVTSAIVGVFFWSGKFEALGNADEDYLIIPDLLISPVDWRSRQVIGISGPIAAGKTTAGRHLEEQGLTYGRFSLVLEKLLRERGEPVNRASLQGVGIEIHEKLGQRWLCRELVSNLPRDKNLVIDGLRFPEDHAYLVESFGPAFMHLHIEASEEIRRQRYVKMGNSADEFDEAIRQIVELRVPFLGERAACRILNDEALEAFKSRLIRVIKRKQRERGGRLANINCRRRAIRVRGKGKGSTRVRQSAKRHNRSTRRRS